MITWTCANCGERSFREVDLNLEHMGPLGRDLRAARLSGKLECIECKQSVPFYLIVKTKTVKDQEPPDKCPDCDAEIVERFAGIGNEGSVLYKCGGQGWPGGYTGCSEIEWVVPDEG